MADFRVDTADLGSLAQVFASAGTDATGIAGTFRSGAGGLTGGDALGEPSLVEQYRQAFDQWASNLDHIATSMEQLGRALSGARVLYEVAEKHATVRTK
ncbi:MAG TPA: hypothetical protein VE781_03280 [Kineosporiaceae bacterium]|nr:hypothetical protein [Kineosporiaceae bacterium]